MGIVSNMNSIHYDDMKEAINESGLDKYFLFSIFSNEPGLCPKPCYDIFDLAMKHINMIDRTIQPNEVLFVGNSYINDIMGAKNYGFLTAYVQNVPPTQYDIDVFKKGQQTLYLSSIDHLMEAINEYNK
jgi:FMN phosphatase YigB (HAD superfamily)